MYLLFSLQSADLVSSKEDNENKDLERVVESCSYDEKVTQ